MPSAAENLEEVALRHRTSPIIAFVIISATGSVALICTNAMRELFLYDDNLDNF